MEKINDFLDNPSSRTSVLILDKTTYYSWQYDDDKKHIFNTFGLLVIPIDSLAIFNQHFELIGSNSLRPDMLLVLSPYNSNIYTEITNSRQEISIEKFHSTLHFCQLLGVKYFAIDSLKIVDKNSKQSIDLTGLYTGVDTNVNFSNMDLTSFKDKINIKAKFTGGSSNYNLAKEYLFSKKLQYDEFLMHLLEMKNPAVDNKLTSFDKELCLTEKIQNNLDFIANIKFPTGYINTKYKQVLTSQIDINMKLTLEF